VVEHVVSLGAYRLNVTVSPAARLLVPSRSALSSSVVPKGPSVGIAVLVIVVVPANTDRGPTTNKPTAMSPADATAIARRARVERPGRV
jgi:hypothetical protein